MSSASSASNVFFSDDLPEASGSKYQLLNNTSPIPLGLNSPGRQCRSSQTASQRRGVVWSEQIDNVKLFYKADSIHPSPESPTKSGPPASIRSYLHEQDLNTTNSPHSSPLFRVTRKFVSSPLSSSSASPLPPRSILKRGDSEIRVAASVEEGGWLNKEPARLLVCGKRPRIVARDSFQVAKMREAAADAGGKGKGKARADPPAADHIAQEAMYVGGAGEMEGESEEEEEAIEEGGALMTATLVRIILNGAEDLLTLEEAYTTLTLRLKAKLVSHSSTSDVASGIDEAIRIAVCPVREEAPAIVRALQRDFGRLIGKHPGLGRSSDRESSPFPTCQILRDMPTPSPTPEPSTDSPKRRRGFTDAEIRYRREAAGVGQSALKFLAVVFRAHQLYDCFSQADLTALLDQAMIIPRTAKLPTLHPKKSYRWSIFLLSQMRIPPISVGPVQDKVVSAVEAAMTSALVPAGVMKRGKEDEEIRKEGIRAAMNIITHYPAIFLQHYSSLLPPILKGMYDPAADTRVASSAACAAFAAAKVNIQQSTTDALFGDHSPSAKQEWQKVKALAQKVEFWVAAHLKMTIKDTRPLVERRTHSDLLLKTFKEKMGSPDGVLWCCAAIGVLTSLLGGAYPTSCPEGGLFDYILSRALAITANSTRPVLARMAWSHGLHAYLTSGLSTSLSADGQLIRSYKPFPFPFEPEKAAERLNLLQLPVNLALQLANAPEAASKVLYTLPDSTEQRYKWQRAERSKNRQSGILICGGAASAVVYAYTGIALQHQDQQMRIASCEASAIPEASAASQQIDRLNETWEKVVRPMLSCLHAVEGIDSLKIIGWRVLLAITSPESSTVPWSLDFLLSRRYLDGLAFGISQEITTTADFVFDLEGDAIKPSEIPAWGAAWVLNCLPALLDVLKEAIVGVRGVDEVGFTGWVRTPSGAPVLPTHLNRVWANLLKSIASVRIEHPAAFVEGIQTVIAWLVSLWDLHPSAYLPIGVFGPQGCAQNLDETRLTLVSRFVDLAIDILGRDAIGETCIIDFPLAPVAQCATSPDVLPIDGQNTPSSLLLSALLRSSQLSPSLSEGARLIFESILVKLLDLGRNAPNCRQQLNDITVSLPSLSANGGLIQQIVWRELACSWRLHMQDRSVSSWENSSTSGLLISLLVAPFHHTTASTWDADAFERDLPVWKGLMEVTIQQTRVQGVETNEGVLNVVARQLARYRELGVNASALASSLSCLPSMLLEMGLAMTYHNSTHLPLELLQLVSSALHDCHSTFQARSPESEPEIPPGIGPLIQSLTATYALVPAWSAAHLLAPSVSTGMYDWLAAANSAGLCASLDALYCAALDLLSRAIASGDIAPTGETLDAYSEIYGPHLSLAGSPAVLLRFQQFWRESFANVELELSDNVREFLMDVMAAMPGLIEAKGMEQSVRMSEEESQRRFPHSHGLIIERSPLVSASDPVKTGIDAENAPSTSIPGCSTEASPYLGLHINDTSAPPWKQPALGSPIPTETLPPSSPFRIDDSSDRTGESTRSEDVFGPPAMISPRKRARRSSKSRSISLTQSLPEMQVFKRTKHEVETSPVGKTIIPDSQDDAEETEEDEDLVMVEEKVVAGKEAEEKPTIFGRLLTKATSFGFFSSPNRKRPEADSETFTPASDTSHRVLNKRPRNDTAAADSDPGPQHPSSSRSSSSRSTPPSSQRSKSGRSKRSRTEGKGGNSGSSRSSSHSGSLSSNPIIAKENDDEENDNECEVPPSSEIFQMPPAERIAQGGALDESQLQSNSPRFRFRGQPKKAKVQTPPSTQGRYDDALEDTSTLRLPEQASAPFYSSPTRTTQQARILNMLEEATRAKAAVESLDFEGVMNLLKHVEELRVAATANLEERARRERGARRT